LYARAGRFADAARVTREALAIAEEGDDAAVATQLRARLAEYDARR
jgi:hypothetical protein